MKLAFDSLALAAVVRESQPLVGGKLQRILQIDDYSIAVSIYLQGEQWLLISTHPQFARAHLMSRRPAGISPPPPFAAELRRRLVDARVAFIRQRGLDRILEIGIQTVEQNYILVAEMMGKHSNLMLVDQTKNVVAALRYVGAAKSRRPILPGKPYTLPPFEPKPPITEAEPSDNLKNFEGWSPSLQALLDAGLPFNTLRNLRNLEFEPHFAPGIGAAAFPFPQGYPRQTMSIALEQHYADLSDRQSHDQAKASLKSQLERVLLARETALHDINQALDAADHAGEMQKQAELLLAYQGAIPAGADQATVWDYEGRELHLPLNPDLSVVENAERIFLKAKKAKSRRDEIAGQGERLEADRQLIEDLILKVEEAPDLRAIEDLKEEADRRKWLHKHAAPLAKEDRPYAGHSIREFLSPAGWKILVGTNATGNDHLTSKVAKPNDWWLHVRGAPSAHVVIQTSNQPDRVQKSDMMFAAELAIRFSPLKHSNYVSVDYTLKKYVRKPRGSAPGLATYEREKTLHVGQ
jgi:predicted ribosome quality control (RQC) complex YloA/Tae2 family protein